VRALCAVSLIGPPAPPPSIQPRIRVSPPPIKMANRPTLALRARMAAGEAILLLLAFLDHTLRAWTAGLLRLSVNRPSRPTAAAFARQQVAAAAAATSVDAVVIGGASAGLAAAAALANRGIVAAVLDRRLTPGDGWRTRYASLHLHDLADECSLPFMPLPSSLPVYVPAGVFADYLDAYARIQRLDWRGGHEVVGVERVGDGTWRVTATRAADGSSVQLTTPTVVFADGGLYNSPRIPGWATPEQASSFTGAVLHSSSISAAAGSVAAAFKGRRVLVVGFGNSSSDVLQELAAAPAAEVVLAVRDPASRALAPQADVGRFQETNHSFPWLPSAWGDDAADWVEASGLPRPFRRGVAWLLRTAAAALNSLFDAALAARAVRAWGPAAASAGLDILPGHGGHSPVQWTRRTGSVMVMDTGALATVAAGCVRVVRAGVRALGPGAAVHLDDRTRLEGVDAVVLCTGFNSMTQAAALLPPDVRSSLGMDTGSGLAPGTFLVRPEDSKGGRIQSGARTGVAGLYFIVGRLAAQAASALTLADNVAADQGKERRVRKGWLPGPDEADLPVGPWVVRWKNEKKT
jgi:cation diffusion facilitator CzcD-associated flavoprotein CzcO